MRRRIGAGPTRLLSLRGLLMGLAMVLALVVAVESAPYEEHFRGIGAFGVDARVLRPPDGNAAEWATFARDKVYQELTAGLPNGPKLVKGFETPDLDAALELGVGFFGSDALSEGNLVGLIYVRVIRLVKLASAKIEGKPFTVPVYVDINVFTSSKAAAKERLAVAVQFLVQRFTQAFLEARPELKPAPKEE